MRIESITSMMAVFVLASLVMSGMHYAAATPTGAGLIARNYAASVNDSVLISFPDGAYYWYYSSPADYSSALNLTAGAAAYFGLGINYSAAGFVNEIGGFWNVNSSDGPFWSLWEWNGSTSAWQLSNVGAGEINMSSTTSVAWSYSLWSTTTYLPYYPPQQTPADPNPVPSYRGSPGGSGAGTGFSNMQPAPPADTLSWKGYAGSSIDVQPVDGNGLVYLVTDGKGNTSSVMAYNSYGDRVWTTEIGSIGFEVAAPLYADGMLIVPSTDGSIYMLNATTGSVLHIIVNVSSSPEGLTGAPVLGPEGFYIINGSGGADYYAFNASLIWNASIGKGSYYSTPAYYGGELYAFSTSSGLTDLSELNGSSGAVDARIATGGVVYGSPAVSGSRLLFISSGLSSSSGYVNITVHCLVLPSLAYLWNHSAGNSTGAPSSPALAGGMVIYSSGGFISALNLSSGSMIWSNHYGSQFSSPAPFVYGSYIFSSTNSNSSSVAVYALNGTRLWEFAPSLQTDYSLSSAVFNGTSTFWGDDSGHIYSLQKAHIVRFTYTQAGGSVNLSAGIDSGLTGVSNFTWSAGGKLLYGPHPSIHFGSNGNYTVTLSVNYSNGSVAYYTAAVKVDTAAGGRAVPDYAAVAIVGVPLAIAVVAAALLTRRHRKKGR